MYKYINFIIHKIIVIGFFWYQIFVTNQPIKNWAVQEILYGNKTKILKLFKDFLTEKGK